MFGYKQPSHSVPCWWGARAILKRQVIDFLQDRQQLLGTDEVAKKALATWLDKHGIPKLIKLVKAEFLGNDEEREVRVEHNGFYLVANPNMSHGYLYIGAGRIEDEPKEQS